MIRDIPESVRTMVTQQLADSGLGDVRMIEFSFSHGGCINHGGRLSTSQGDFFLKWNDASAFPGMFSAEARGIELLASTETVEVPVVQGTSEDRHYQYLLLEFVKEGSRGPSYWSMLGEQLAHLHMMSAEHFGLDHDNYIGSLPQINSRSESWVDFFVQARLEPLARRLDQSGSGSNLPSRKLEKLYARLPQEIPEESPALLHGDLWSGNLMINPSGMPALIDPAVYYGHREMDLAFTTLFGRFDSRFYEAYEAVHPLQPGYEDRFDLHNLYPLLVHANLFGGHYVQQVFAILDRFL
jgi:protein-ribulosamine 3-kinase